MAYTKLADCMMQVNSNYDQTKFFNPEELDQTGLESGGLEIPENEEMETFIPIGRLKQSPSDSSVRISRKLSHLLSESAKDYLEEGFADQSDSDE